jgi:AraC-like DNA-binding protein
LLVEYLEYCFASATPPRAGDLAARLGCSPPRFSNLFLGHFGERPADYLKRQQIDQAKCLLRSTNLNMTEVGAAAAFRTRMTFFRAFRRVTGMTPHAFRQSTRSNTSCDDGRRDAAE